MFILYIFYIIFQCIGTLDWIRSEGHTGVIRYKLLLSTLHSYVFVLRPCCLSEFFRNGASLLGNFTNIIYVLF